MNRFFYDNPANYIESMMIALVNASKDTYSCNRPPGAAGAWIVPLYSKHNIIYAGVGPPEGSPTCKTVGCEIVWETFKRPPVCLDVETVNDFHPHCVRTIHAEQRAIATAAKNGVPTDGSTMYSVLKPCYDCTKLIITAGIVRIFYAGVAYDEERTRTILANAGVECIHVDVKLEYGNANL